MPRRHIPPEEQCVERIQVQVGIGYDYVQCSNKGKYIEAGRLVCGTHSQAAEDRREERREKRMEAYLADIRERSQAEAERNHKINCFPNLLALLKYAQRILHGDLCQQYDTCVDACDQAREAIKEAEKKPEVRR